MKFPSIKTLAEGFKKTLTLYPFEIAFALVGTIAATVNVEVNSVNRVAESWCIRVMMMANLGLLLSLASTLYAKSIKASSQISWGLKTLVVLITIALCLLLNPYYEQSDYLRFFLLSLCFHLLVAYAGFTVKGHIHGFWQFNKTVFLRILTSVLYSGVLFVGLAAAIGALNFLFTFKFEWDTFLILWIWIVGMFNTFFFLAGVPTDLNALDQDESYPKGLKVFTQYVLVPLATVYVLILLAYEVKILLQWSLPKGLVSNIILGYAVFGILSLLLVYPIREREENKWLKTYAKTFYFLLLPLLVLLFAAVGTRVFRYGVTEERYFLIVLAFWLLFISLYFLLFKRQNIKLIPISLSVLTLLSVYGPQSAFSVSEYSQTRILLNIFKKHNAFKDGKLMPLTTKLDSVSGAEAAAKVNYLVRNHDFASLQPYLSKDLNAVGDSLSNGNDRGVGFSRYELRYAKTEWMIKHLNLTNYYGRYGYVDTAVADGVDVKNMYDFKTEDIVNISGNDLMIDVNYSDTGIVRFDGITISRKVTDYNDMLINIDREKFAFKATDISRTLLKRNDLTKYSIKKDVGQLFMVPPELLTIEKKTLKYKVTLVLDNLSFGKTGEKIKPMYVSGIYLIKKL